MEAFSDEELEAELERRRRERASGMKAKAGVGGAFCTVDGTCEMFE